MRDSGEIDTYDPAPGIADGDSHVEMSFAQVFRVLLVEDNPGDMLLIRELLREVQAQQFIFDRAECLADALQRLAPAEGEKCDVILLDLGLPDSQGLTTFEAVHGAAAGTPIVVLTGLEDEDIALRAVQAGAQDYLVKGRLAGYTLARAIRYAIERQRVQRMLERREAELEALVENSPDVIARLDRNLRLVYVNSAVQRLGGGGPEEFIGKTTSEIGIPTEMAAAWQAVVETVFDTRREASFEFELPTASRVTFYETRVVPEYSPDGSVETALCLARDVTDRVQAQRALRRYTQRLENLREIDYAILQAVSVETIAEKALKLTRNLVPCERASVALYDHNRGVAHIISDEDAERGPGAGSEVSLGDFTPVEILRHAPARHIKDLALLEHRSALQDYLMAQGLRSVLTVPMLKNGNVVGTLNLGAAQPAHFTPGDAEAAVEVGNHLAIALQQARLHEQTEQRMQRLTALRTIDLAIMASADLKVSLDVILGQVTTQLAVDGAAVLLLNEHNITLEHVAFRGIHPHRDTLCEVPVGRYLAGRAALDRDTVMIPDLSATDAASKLPPCLQMQGLVGYCAVPLLVKGQVKGVLEILHRQPLDRNRDWHDFLAMLAGQTAIAVDNVHLFTGLERSNTELTLAYDTTLERWARTLELRDLETEGHARRVTELIVRLARRMGVDDEDLVHTRRGALLHDIGILGIPDTILFKPGPLTDEEWEVIHLHPVHAYELLSPVNFLRPALEIPYAHHEKWDGTGYPRRLTGEQIPLEARIFAVVDVWDSLRSDRPYRAPWSTDTALGYIREQAGRHFDPNVVAHFLALVPDEEQST